MRTVGMGLYSSVPGTGRMGGGGGDRTISLPYSVDFSALPNGPLPGDFTAPTWTVDTGKAKNTPLLGPELVTNGTFDSDLSGWNNYSTPYNTVEWSDGKVHLVSTSTSLKAFYSDDNIPMVAGDWYFVSQSYVRASGNHPVCGILASAFAPGVELNPNADTVAFRCPSSGNYVYQIHNLNVADFTLDNLSVRRLGLSDLMAVLPPCGSAAVTIQAVLSYPIVAPLYGRPGTPIGFVLNYQDANNYALAYLDGKDNAKLESIINGVVTLETSATIVYADTKNFKVVVDNYGYYTMYYGATGSEAQVGDKRLIAGMTGTRHGLFSTYAQNRISNISIDATAPVTVEAGGTALDETWRIAGADPFAVQSHPGVTNPVIVKTTVTDLTGMSYVADPFIAKDGSTYYLFFEAYHIVSSVPYQKICYATSPDGITWTYGAKILDHTNTSGCKVLSYPYVFKVDGDWYMIPCRSDFSAVLYKATTFPTVWAYVDTLITGVWQPRDVTLFQWGGVFYLLAWSSTDNNCRLFFSDTLYGTGAWQEHPSSPILTGSRNSRPGGRPIVRAASIDIFLQDNVASYGNKTRIYKITGLSKTACTVSELAGSPILDADGLGWNSHGMHTLDRVDSTLSVVDGKDANSFWSIGIYRDVP